MHPPENRLSAISADNHQPWLWFIHVFLIIFVLLGAGMRVWMKWKNAALADALLLSAHVSTVELGDRQTRGLSGQSDRFCTSVIGLSFYLL